MEMLQQMYMVEVDHRQLYPAIEYYDNTYYIQYDLGNEHTRFEVTERNLYNTLYCASVKRKVIEWVNEIKSY